VRAKELSASTSSPLPFIVLRAWAVSDGRAAIGLTLSIGARSTFEESRVLSYAITPFAELQVLLEIAVKLWLLDS
jgi:hypothetical protein